MFQISKDFWLYIVTGAKTSTPELHRIRNPASQFRMDESIFAIGFIVPMIEWQRVISNYRR